MWYLIWLLGIGFAILFSIVVALWGEYEFSRKNKQPEVDNHGN